MQIEGQQIQLEDGSQIQIQDGQFKVWLARSEIYRWGSNGPLLW